MREPDQSATTRPLCSSPLAGLFGLAVLFACGAFLYFGDIPKHVDDYHLGLAPDGSPPTRYTWLFPFFFRPLQRTLPYAMVTALWEHDRVLHLIGVVLQACSATLVGVLLRCLGLSWRPVIAGAAVYLLHPMLYELVFWPSAYATNASVACVLGVLILAVRQARSPRWWRALLCPALAFAAMCFNEQPAAMLAGMPMLMLAAGRDGGATLGVRSLRGAALTVTPVFLACIGYVVLQRSTMPAYWPGSPESSVRPVELGDRYSQVARGLAYFMAYHKYPGAVLTWAYEALRAHPLRAGLFACASLVGWIGFSRWFSFVHSRTGGCAVVRRSTLALIALGASAMLLATPLPIALVRGYGAGPRMCAGIVVGLALLGSLATHALLTLAARARSRRARAQLRGLAAGLVAGVGLWHSALLLGFQHGMRECGLGDRAIARGLVREFPRVPSWCVFVPLLNEAHRPRADIESIDNLLRNAFVEPWGSRGFVRHVYRRMDVFASSLAPWRCAHEFRPGDDALWVEPPLDTWFRPPGPSIAPDWNFPLSHVAAFTLDARGNLRRVGSIVRITPDGSRRTLTLPLGSGGEVFVWRDAPMPR